MEEIKFVIAITRYGEKSFRYEIYSSELGVRPLHKSDTVFLSEEDALNDAKSWIDDYRKNYTKIVEY